MSNDTNNHQDGVIDFDKVLKDRKSKKSNTLKILSHLKYLSQRTQLKKILLQ